MKTRKLMAVLVMVAMIVTALPVVALGAEGNPDLYSVTRSTVTGDTSARLDKEFDFKINFRDSAGSKEVETPVTFFLYSDRDTEEIVATNSVVSASSFKLNPRKAVKVDAIPDGSGQVAFELKSHYPGTAKIHAYAFCDNDNGDYDVKDLTGHIGTLTVNVKSTEKVDVELEAEYVGEKVGDENEPEAGRRFELIATVSRDNAELEGVKVSFYDVTKRLSVFLGEAKTDSLGVAKLKIDKEKADTYQFEARAEGEKSKKAKVIVVAGAAYSLEADKEERDLATGTKPKIKFIVKDRYGNKVKKQSDVVEAELITKPSGSYAEIEPVTVDDVENDNELASTNKDGEAVFVIDELDEEGKYVLEARLEELSGVKAITTIHAEKLGEIVGLEIDTDGRYIIQAVASPATLEFSVNKVDERGVTAEAKTDEVRASSSNPRIAKVAVEGDEFVVEAQDEDRLGKVTITVTHIDEGLSASVDITVVGEPVAIDVVEVDADGLAADITLQLVDFEGNNTFTKADREFTVVAPDLKVLDADKFNNKTGKATFSVEAEEAGTYKVRVVSDLGISKTFEVTLSEEPVKVVEGAEKVTLFIGNDFANVDGAMEDLDAPAFIEDGRTYVPFRFLGEAFGAEVDWDPKDGLVETVTLLRDDVEVVIGIGEEFATVTKDGEAEVVSFEGLGAAKIVGGRTYLPFRAVADIFGAEVDYGTDEDGFVTWVSFEQ